MKVLLVNHFPLEGSGSGVYTKNIAKRLKEKGHKVEVIAVDKYKNKGNGFPVKTIINYNFPCFTTHPHSNNQFYHLTNDEMDEYLNAFIKTINFEVNKFQPDIIHCQHIWVAPYAASKTNKPYIITAHGTDLKGYKKDKRYHFIANKAAENAEYIITISKYINESVKKIFPQVEDKLRLILNGFDENIFKPLDLDKKNIISKYLGDNFEFNDNVKIINFTGKLTNFKGVDLLLKAADIYNDKLDNNVVTLIIGDGELRKELRSLKEKFGLDSMYFLGNLPQSSLVELYNIADITIVPSRVEPFGLVALESLACGTPVIASNAGGLPDFINDNVGRLFPVEDYECLANEIIEAINNNEKQKKGKKASEYAINNYSWDRVVNELLEVYNEIVGEDK